MQCDYITTTGQCQNEAVPPSRFCEDHSATSANTLLNQYRVSCKLLGDSLERHAAADQIKDLKAEIAILRSMVERRLNTIETDAELAAFMPTLKDFAISIQKLAESTHNMDVKLGNLLDKQALMGLAQEIIQIIATAMQQFVGREPTQVDIDESVEDVGKKIVEAIATKENSK